MSEGILMKPEIVTLTHRERCHVIRLYVNAQKSLPRNSDFEFIRSKSLNGEAIISDFDRDYFLKIGSSVL